MSYVPPFLSDFVTVEVNIADTWIMPVEVLEQITGRVS